MTETGFDERVLNDALVRAVRAPSVHNSQPWRWRVVPHGVDLYTTRRAGCHVPTPPGATRS